MYGEVKIAADVTLTTPTAFATPAGGQMRFHVEEEEMFVVLEFQGAYAQTTAPGTVFSTFFVDGADVGDLVDGIFEDTVDVTAQGVYFKKTMRLAQGEHLLEVRFKAGSNNVVVHGAGVPCTLSATRLSHNATVAANQNSKQTGGVY
jgi:hypothetical protein